MFLHLNCMMSPILIPPSYIANRNRFLAFHLSVFSLRGRVMSLFNSLSWSPVMVGGVSLTVMSFLGISSACSIPSSTALFRMARSTLRCFAMELGDRVVSGFLLFCKGLQIGGESRDEGRCDVPEVHILHSQGLHVVREFVDRVPIFLVCPPLFPQFQGLPYVL